jgi:hypothetical protein
VAGESVRRHSLAWHAGCDRRCRARSNLEPLAERDTCPAIHAAKRGRRFADEMRLINGLRAEGLVEED